jgi:hypothetical protein
MMYEINALVLWEDILQRQSIDCSFKVTLGKGRSYERMKISYTKYGSKHSAISC